MRFIISRTLRGPHSNVRDGLNREYSTHIQSFIASLYLTYYERLTNVLTLLTLYHPAARQFCRSTYTITDNTSK
jgi:hypothetical protein